MHRSRTIRLLLPIVTATLLTGTTAHGQTRIYVDADAFTNGADGTSWETAYPDLQDALSDASSNAWSIEIWVAEGIYMPDGGRIPVGGLHVSGTGDRTATFQLLDDVAIYGGFAGDETSLDQRDSETYKTTLSGDLAGDDGRCFANNDENSFHVVTGSSNGLLDGFTITSGNADGAYLDSAGGGMFNHGGSPPTSANCTFSGNMASSFGGGMFNQFSSPTLSSCTFSGNVAGGSGGGMVNWGSWSTLTNCTFRSNSAEIGGGMDDYMSSLALTNCTFSGNSAGRYGGGIFDLAGSPTLANCTFSGNVAGSLGGGMCQASYENATLGNCILWGNTASAGAQIYSGSISVTYSCVQGGWTGMGNIGINPLLVDADGVDDIIGTEDDDLRLLPGSPCIDAGTNEAVPPEIGTDLDGNPRIVDGDGDGTDIVDMGAYEFLPIFLDIKPGSCPNPLNRSSHGLLPVALLGTAHFDATAIDVSSVRLWRADGVGGEVAPNEGPPGPHSVFEDVGTPFSGEWCDCHDLTGDGTVDLMMYFKTNDVVAALQLNDLDPGALVALVVSGNLLDGTPFTSAGDCVRLEPPGAPGTDVSFSSRVGSVISSGSVSWILEGVYARGGMTGSSVAPALAGRPLQRTHVPPPTRRIEGACENNRQPPPFAWGLRPKWSGSLQ